MVDVAGEHLLIGRYGMLTWGHWLGELLPKITLVEDAFPGRFKFVLPDDVVDDAATGAWLTIQQSIAACGVDRDRIFPAQAGNNYRFSQLFALTSVFSDHVMHPAASSSLRRAVASIPPSADRKLAVIRDARYGRSIVNASEIYGMLDAAGFSLQQAGSKSFVEQVSLFKGGETVFGVLGSDLTNILFSPGGVKVISAAPDQFGDRFFYALVLDRTGSMIDIRGPAVKHRPIDNTSNFSVDGHFLQAAIAKFEH